MITDWQTGFIASHINVFITFFSRKSIKFWSRSSIFAWQSSTEHHIPSYVKINLCRRYVKENSWAAMLATKRSAGVALDVNLWECVSHTPMSRANKTVHSGFETQRRHHQKSKIGISMATNKRTYVLQIFLKKQKISLYLCSIMLEESVYFFPANGLPDGVASLSWMV